MSLFIRRQGKEVWNPGGGFRTITGYAVLNTIKIGAQLQVRVHSLHLGAQLKSLVQGPFLAT